MHHVDFHQNQDHVKLSSPGIILMSRVTPVKLSIMVAVIAMPTDLRRRIFANISANSTVRKTTSVINCNFKEAWSYLFNDFLPQISSNLTIN